MTETEDQAGPDAGGGAVDAERMESFFNRLLAEQRKTSRWMRFMPAMAVVQLLIGAPAFIISVFVAYATFVQADATKKIQEASSWPFLEATVSFNNAGEAYVEVGVVNSGVGPAIIRGYAISYEGEAMNDWPAVAVAANSGVWNGSMSTRDLPKVIQAGEYVRAVQVRGGSMRGAFARALSDDRITGEICFCSIYERCWIVTMNAAEPPPQMVASCPAYGEDQFLLRQPELYDPATFGEEIEAVNDDAPSNGDPDTRL